MANNEPRSTDSFWFLDNLEDEESKFTENESTDNEKGGSDSGILISENFQQTDSIQSTKDSNSIESKSISEDNDQEKTIEDEISLKSELERSLFDLAKESISKGKNPEFRITVSSSDSENSQQNVSSESSENSKKAKTINIESNGTEIIDENKNIDITKPKVFVILKSNPIVDFKSKIGKENVNLDKAEQVCSEIGSSVINLNDFISPQAKPVTGGENISTSVNFIENDEEKRKVELVITIKDERSKPSEDTAAITKYRNEINSDFPNLDSLLFDESLDSEMKSLSGRTQKVSSRTSTDTWQASKASRVRGYNSQDKWSESKDSFIRESDGAQCYRTVTSTPWGRRVHTQCYKDDRRGARRHSRWTSGFGSFLQDFDDDFNHMFTRLNRLMFY